MVSSFESPQEQKEIDQPISLKDLQTASMKANRNHIREQVIAAKSPEHSQFGSTDKDSLLKGELPDSIRKVKEEIKKKIIRYNQYISCNPRFTFACF